MSLKTLIVDADCHHMRVDAYLAEYLDDAPSRTFVKRVIESGGVVINDVPVKAHHKVCEGDVVKVKCEIIREHNPAVVPEDIPLNIIYEDEYLIAINKPSGMVVHPAPGCVTGTLVNALLFHYKDLSDVNSGKDNSGIRPGIVHRLDQETSGLILVAKDNGTHINLARQFEKRMIKKKYVALVAGKVEFDEGRIDAPLSRHPRHREKKAVTFFEESKNAETFYKVTRRFSDASLVALFPKTGRTHQLRVHMSYLGHPILGDAKYGSVDSFSRLALHAQCIGFVHPRRKKYFEFSVPIPDQIQAFISKQA